ncbi:MAG: lysophospholipid acyltransferase family protein [Phycisphaerae bacterium]|nr:lysophospholipid acyltransferase family protein [Phycisphaerae bacterium]
MTAEPKARRWVHLVLWLGHIHRRLLGVYFAILGPSISYRVSAALARLLYRLLDPIRARSEAQCAAALGQAVSSDEVPGIAERAFVQRIWDLTDLALADRLIHAGTYRRYGGGIPEPDRTRLLDAQRRGQPCILVTGYYGPFDLLPLFLGYNGIRAGVVYRPHANRAFDAYRNRIRGRSGCELIPVDRAAGRLGEILEAGGTVAVLADQPAERHGTPVTFLGLPTTAMRSVGLLAWRFGADVVVSGIRRINDEFRFEIVVADVLDHREWQSWEDPVEGVTRRYLRGLEALILGDPGQYLWCYARWGDDLARDLVLDQLGARDAPGHSPA